MTECHQEEECHGQIGEHEVEKTKKEEEDQVVGVIPDATPNIIHANKKQNGNLKLNGRSL